MRNDAGPKTSATGVRLAVVAALLAGALCSLQVLAQVPARFYWHSLSGGNAVPFIYMSMGGNANPFDPSRGVTPDAQLDASMGLFGYARTFTLFDRSATAAVIVPMGRLSGDLNLGGALVRESASGFGDPTLEFDINIIGPKAQKTIPDAMRYEPGFSLDILADLMVPVGEYDDEQPLNIGQHRWYGRVGFPVVWQLGAWVPGRRTTLEFLPAVWLFGDNDDFMNKTLETDPMFQLDAHLTRDFAEDLWGSLDAVWYNGGKATLDGIPGDKISNVAIGVTVGYTINDNVALTFGYKSTIDDSAPTDLKMDGFMFSIVFGWHPIVEGSKRLKGGE